METIFTVLFSDEVLSDRLDALAPAKQNTSAPGKIATKANA